MDIHYSLLYDKATIEKEFDAEITKCQDEFLKTTWENLKKVQLGLADSTFEAEKQMTKYINNKFIFQNEIKQLTRDLHNISKNAVSKKKEKSNK